MRIASISVRNFRRLENVDIDMETDETVLVGPNNSGKTSATAALRCFLGSRDFIIHDLSVSRVKELEAFASGTEAVTLPTIELDIWFSVDPDSIAFGRAFTLLPKLSDDYTELGVRLKYRAVDGDRLRIAYKSAYPAAENGSPKRSLSQYLGMDGNFKKHFDIAYFSLERTGVEIAESFIEKAEGTQLLRILVRVDFIDAQRNIDDEEAHRSNRLSVALATFYKRNLEQAEMAEAANAVIDANNVSLTAHYDTHFEPLMNVIKGLGVPSVNDRDLKIVSSLSPESALQGNTDLLYIDTERGHELPEAYNGLGFKNLVYMAIQISHFHLQWMRTESNRPLCQLIIIEEPEVHLHAQVQQTFIKNIWGILNNAAASGGNSDLVPQITVTTHSAHILDAVEFANVRYFRRCALADEDATQVNTLNASQVHSLRMFTPDAINIEGQKATEEEALMFLKQYLRLTHCDLFFADAAILVEGTVEKLLLPKMIEESFPGLRRSYLTILEVGGAYAHRFAGLLNFLKIPYLVITDIDSVEPAGNHKACRADSKDALTSNASLKDFFGVTTIAELVALEATSKFHEDDDRYVAFQTEVVVENKGTEFGMLGRTFEEAFVYQNFSDFTTGNINLGVDIPAALPDAFEAVYERVRSSGFKKTQFALDVLASAHNWAVPAYIAEGLDWLEHRLNVEAKAKVGNG